MQGFEVQMGSCPDEDYPGQISWSVSFGDKILYLHRDGCQLFREEETNYLHIDSLFGEERNNYWITIQYLDDSYWAVTYSDGHSEIRKDEGGLEKISLHALEEFSCSEEQDGIDYTYQSTLAAGCTPIECYTRNPSTWTFGATVMKSEEDITYDAHNACSACAPTGERCGCATPYWLTQKWEAHNPPQENDDYLYEVNHGDDNLPDLQRLMNDQLDLNWN